MTWGWSGAPDPDLDSATLRFRAEAYSDSLLQRVLIRRDSLRVRRLALGDFAGSIPDPTTAWFRVEARDARGYSTGFGPARRYVIGDLTPTAPAAPRGSWSASFLRLLDGRHLLLSVPARAAGSRITATLLDIRGTRGVVLFDGTLPAGLHRLPVTNSASGWTGVGLLRVESSMGGGAFLVPAW
jgi:hypothetical protein